MLSLFTWVSLSLSKRCHCVQVHAVQACGGQKTSLGDRCRTGGGVLWNILKARDPNAYKEIMKKGREFEVCIVVLFNIHPLSHSLILSF